MHRTSLRTIYLLIISLLSALTLSAETSGAPKIPTFTPCEQPGFEALRAALPALVASGVKGLGKGRCATWRVFEDRATQRGRQIDLRLMILPATSGKAAPDPIYAITGGPGGSIVASPWISLVLGPARRDRDVVLIDQRGTGGSNPLACSEISAGVEDHFRDNWLPPEAVVACRKELEKRADLRFYTTELAVQDLEEVRRVLGHGKINLWGGSYGTQVAQVYLKRHPDSIRSVVLSGVAPLDTRPPLNHAFGGQKAFDRWIDRCASDRACSEPYPNPRGDLQRVLERLETAPAVVTLDDPLNGKKLRIALDRDAFAEKLRGLLYMADQAAAVPNLLSRAATGDFKPFVERVLMRERAVFLEGNNWFTGLFLSVTCSESLPYFDDAEAQRRGEGTFLDTYRVDRQRQACRHWVRGEIPEDFYKPARSDVPVLLLNGELDPVTLTGGAAEVAKHLPRGRLIELPHSGHASADPACSARLTAEFYHLADAKKLDTSCVGKIRPAPWF